MPRVFLSFAESVFADAQLVNMSYWFHFSHRIYLINLLIVRLIIKYTRSSSSSANTNLKEFIFLHSKLSKGLTIFNNLSLNITILKCVQLYLDCIETLVGYLQCATQIIGCPSQKPSSGNQYYSASFSNNSSLAYFPFFFGSNSFLCPPENDSRSPPGHSRSSSGHLWSSSTQRRSSSNHRRSSTNRWRTTSSHFWYSSIHCWNSENGSVESSNHSWTR